MKRPDLGVGYILEDSLVVHESIGVFLGYETQYQTPLVFKCLDLNRVKDWSLIQAFQYEAELLSQIRHPRIPQMIDLHETPNKELCLIQTFMPGDNLQSHVQKKGPLDETLVISMAAQTLKILQSIHMHQPPILHLDIKPSNLMLDKTEVFLIDFGNALMGDKIQIAQGGTPGYTPNEQLSGQPLPQSDLYALGATCIHLLSGLEITTLLNGNTIEFWEELNCSTALKNWIEVMVNPKYSLRFQNAEEALDQLLTNFPDCLHDIQVIPDRVELIQSEFTASERDSQLTHHKPELEGMTFIKCLKQNGGTTTWLALTKEKTKVVIKHLKIEGLESLNEFKDFEREVFNLSHLNEEAFPQLLDFVKHENEWFLIQSFQRGESFQNKVENGWQLDLNEFLSVAFKCLKVLNVLHSQTPPLIHRDLQPENILIDDDNVRLLDFGGAEQRLLITGSGGSTRTGTFGYTAPEQYVGMHSPASDLYGLGMCLLFVLRKRSPATFQRKDLILDLDDLDIPLGLKGWLQRLTHLDPLERPQTAEIARSALIPQSQIISENHFKKVFKAKKRNRLESLKKKERIYKKKLKNKQDLYCDHPWAERIDELGLNMPPTLRLQLAPETDTFKMRIPTATSSREKGMGIYLLITKILLGLGLLCAIPGLLFWPLFLGLTPYLLAQCYLHLILKPVLLNTKLNLSGNRVKWSKEPVSEWKSKTLGFPHDQYSYSKVRCELKLRKSPFPLSQNYYDLLWYDLVKEKEMFRMENLFLLEKEVPWIQYTLPKILNNLDKNSTAS